MQAPWELIITVVVNVILLSYWITKISTRTESNEKDIAALKATVQHDMEEIKKENADLKKELREIRDILIQVKSSTDLLMLGRIKTGARQE